MPSPRLVELTEEQRAIVEHDHGPALVFAVAGAGKTTAAAHRVERLVRQRVFPPEKILATSFSVATVADLRRALDTWPSCAAVKTRTLHGVGFWLMRQAQGRGYLDSVKLDADDKGSLDRQILVRALNLARRRRVTYMDELEGLDQEDFLSYVASCKGNLLYADLDAARLPPEALVRAGQAPAPDAFPWYPALYRLYEEIRGAEGHITFDDMLMTGWELLVRHDDLLSQAQGLFHCVLVDEFQDVNLAQSEMLDLITAPRRHYMVIGDDDQTIYEWRGAGSGFILDFARRYGAKQYLITDNFRCPASQLVLANEVIRHNRQRAPKRLNLTRGFDGQTFVHEHATSTEMGRAIVTEIQAARADGFRPDEIAVLVRLYAQTAPIEQFLIEEQIPYEVVGSVPFYQRPEIVTLLGYCIVARLEPQLAARTPLTDEQVVSFSRAWNHIYNRPTRYLSRELSDRIADAAVHRNATLTRALLQMSATVERPSLADRLRDLAETIQWLATNLQSLPADRVLGDLEARLEYTQHLLQSSGFPETGEGKAASVSAFIAYARGKGTVVDLMRHLEHLSVAARTSADRREPRITLRTIFRAKGLEWPVVVVPDCNEGTIPFGEPERLEEERRLFYVAITRSKRFLHLHHTEEKPISPFLSEARHEHVLTSVRTMEKALALDPRQWPASMALAFVQEAHELGLVPYFQKWWNASADTKTAIAHTIQRFLAAVERQGLLRALRLTAADTIPWKAMAPLPPIDIEPTFPGIETLAARPQPPGRTRTRFHSGDRVRHNHYGTGVVTRVEGPHVIVRFDTWGEKKLHPRDSPLTKM